MRAHVKSIAALSLALCLQACITGQPPSMSSPASFFWLPLLGVSDARAERTRALLDAMLTERGFVSGSAFALSISSDSDQHNDGGLGLGLYAGGYAYYPRPRAPHGSILIEAFDARTLRPVWRATLTGAAIEDETALRRALTAALSSFPAPEAAGLGPREAPDARLPSDDPSI